MGKLQFYNKISRNFLFKFIGTFLIFCFQFIIANFLGAENYGEFTLFISYAAVCQIFCLVGLDQYLIKIIPVLDKKKSKDQFILSFFIFIFFYLLCACIIFFLFPLKYKFYFFLYLFLKSISLLIDGYLQGYFLADKVFFINDTLGNLLKVALILISNLFFNLKIEHIILIVIVTEFFLLFCKTSCKEIFCFKHSGFKIERKNIVKTISYSFSFFLISGFVIILNNIDKIMIEKTLSFYYVGIYKIVQNYSYVINIFISPFVIFWPMISNYYNKSQFYQIESKLIEIREIVIFSAIPLYIFFLFNYNFLINLFDQSIDCSNLFLLFFFMATAVLFDAISGPVGAILTMTNYSKHYLLNNVLTLIINIILNFIFVRWWGVDGIALGTLISVIFNNLISCFQINKLLKIKVFHIKLIIIIFIVTIANSLIVVFLNKILNNCNLNILLMLFVKIIILYGSNFIIFIKKYKKLVSLMKGV